MSYLVGSTMAIPEYKTSDEFIISFSEMKGLTIMPVSICDLHN